MFRASGIVYLILSLVAGGVLARGAQTNGPQLGKIPLREVIAAMTLEEKAKLLVGMGMNIPGLPIDPEDQRVPEKVPGAAGRTHAIARLGIPSLTLSDGPAGVRIDPVRKDDPSRTYYATGFPVATLLASSWDTELVREVGVAMGSEARDYGIDVLLAPAMNIHRNPLGGRNFEYYSEDPLLSGKMAAAFVKGVQSVGVGTSIKHFAANNQEFNRMQSNSLIGERALREIYLKGFEIAVKEAQPWTVMSAYNLINGTYASQSRDLLTTILRDEWGFKGVVMSDWFAGNDPVAQIRAGNDLIMPGVPMQIRAIVEAVRRGDLSERQLDESVERVLRLILQSPTFKGYKYSNQPDLKAHAQVARRAASEGMVLLKNEGGTLPLTRARRVALYGNASYDLIAGGAGSGNVNKAYVVSLDRGLAAAGYTPIDSLREDYLRYLTEQKAKQPAQRSVLFIPPPVPEMAIATDRVRRDAEEADVALITLARNSGEGADRKVEEFTLSSAERALIEAVSDAFHARGKRVIVVLNVCGPIEVASWRDRVDAILLAWQPGQEGGHAIADVLSGRVNPSGRLPMTFPIKYEDVPSARNFPGRELVGKKPLIPDNPFAGKPAEVIYEEGIYVGYRYYSTAGVEPAYEFGYGLSYTDFAYSDFKVSAARFDGQVKATVTITNVGKVPGREVVQLYVGGPTRNLARPARELKAFAKTDLLRPGQSQTLEFTLRAADLASFDPVRSAWVVEAGTYRLMVGASSARIKASAEIEVKSDLVVERAHRALVPQVVIEELRLGSRGR